MTTREKDKQEAIAHLREIIKLGDTVHTVLRHVSKSGMTRGIDVYFMPRCESTGQQLEPVWITAYVGKAIDSPQPRNYWEKSLGLKVGGCGMDMGFHVVNSLSYALYGEGYQCLGKGKCPSAYHNNHRDTVQCEGTMVYNPDGPNTGDRCQFESGKGWVIHSRVSCPRNCQIEAGNIRYYKADNGEQTLCDCENGTVEGPAKKCPKCKGKGRLPNPDGPELFNLTHKDGYALKHRWL